MWKGVRSRKHVPLQTYVLDAEASELMLHGTVSLPLALLYGWKDADDGDRSSMDWRMVRVPLLGSERGWCLERVTSSS
jgi:hypothetical protein